jgi:isopenicillin N synthase-like dioxygenase
MLDLPIIDVAQLRDGSPEEREAAARQLGAACRQIGFFCISAHGIDAGYRRDLFEASRRFFAQSGAYKDALSINRSPHNRGYVALESERLDPQKAPDRKEAFNIGLELAPDAPEIVQARPLRGVNFWPDLAGWRELMLDYYGRCLDIGQVLHRGFCLDLGLEDEGFFDALLARPAAILRLLHYPAEGEDRASGPDQPGAGEHTDYGNITLLMTDGVAGLEVRTRGGEWLDVADTGDLILCNIGDCLMRWTNDVYRSTPHRVRIPDRERYSIAFFLDADPDAVVDPADLHPQAAPRYAPITVGDYLLDRLTATYGRELRAEAGR